MASPHLFTAVVIDAPRRIRFSNRALYRIGTLDKPLALSEINKPLRRIAALSQWLWACLDGEDAAAFATPDDLAEHIKTEKLAELIGALNEAIQLAQPKNAGSSTPAPSPASSSA